MRPQRDTPTGLAPLRAIARAVLPRRLRAAIRAELREISFRRAFAEFRRDPIAGVTNARLLQRLIATWGNEGWSAQGDYLRRVVELLRHRRDITVLECGSGLTTLVAGAVAERTGARVVSLEPHAQWRERVRAALARAGIVCVTLVSAPLGDYGAFDWYQVDELPSAERYALVICDGPPSSTRGGRYGLLPVMRARLTEDCVVLLDDAHRESERSVLRRWVDEFGGRARLVEARDGGRSFAEYEPGAA